MANDKAMEAAAQAMDTAYNTNHGDVTTGQVIEAVVTAYLAALEAEGFVVVPVEPTEAMMQAGWSASGPHPEEGPDDIYRAMIAAGAALSEPMP